MNILQPKPNTPVHVKLIVFCLLVMTALLCATGTGSGADILDDSLSPRRTVNVQFQWTHQGNLSDLSRKDFLGLTGRAPNVEVRLNTSNYVGQNARIFLALPVQINGLVGSDGLKLIWKTRGYFNAGNTTPGNRALIFQGRIDAPVLSDFFSFTIHLDARRLNGKLRYAHNHEIETE